MARALVGLAVAALIAGCGDEPVAETGGNPASRAGDPTTLTGPLADSQGGQIVAQSGCLACHAIGANGNDGPGPALDGIGGRLSATEIRRSLLDPVAPMPSYRSLGDLDVLVRFLSELR